MQAHSRVYCSCAPFAAHSIRMRRRPVRQIPSPIVCFCGYRWIHRCSLRSSSWSSSSCCRRIRRDRRRRRDALDAHWLRVHSDIRSAQRCVVVIAQTNESHRSRDLLVPLLLLLRSIFLTVSIHSAAVERDANVLDFAKVTAKRFRLSSRNSSSFDRLVRCQQSQRRSCCRNFLRRHWQPGLVISLSFLAFVECSRTLRCEYYIFATQSIVRNDGAAVRNVSRSSFRHRIRMDHLCIRSSRSRPWRVRRPRLARLDATDWPAQVLFDERAALGIDISAFDVCVLS
jgi:hypothetical protein